MILRNINPSDKLEWARMRNVLWPDDMDNHLADIDKYFAHAEIDIVQVFVLARNEQELAGFIEINVRNFAEGSRLRKIPYIEGWFVEDDMQGIGYGKQLMLAAEQWSKENGFSELASDTEIVNTKSIEIHKKLGFAEVDRVVCFIKRLTS